MSTEPADTPSNRLRASDAEREKFATIVREAVGEGRLDITEGDARLAALYAARFRDELGPFVADLPAGQEAQRTTTRGRWSDQPGWAPDGAPPSPWERRRGYRYGRHHGGVPGAIAHTSFVVLVAGLLTLLWLVSATHFFWPAIPLFFLVLGLGRHWRWATWRRYDRS
jgi:hypothetical protein